MQKQCPDSRLDFIVEGVKFEGAKIEYGIVEGQDPGWVLHVFEPKVPDTPMIKFPVREAAVNDGDSRARLRSRLDGTWRMCFMD